MVLAFVEKQNVFPGLIKFKLVPVFVNFKTFLDLR